MAPGSRLSSIFFFFSYIISLLPLFRPVNCTRIALELAFRSLHGTGLPFQFELTSKLRFQCILLRNCTENALNLRWNCSLTALIEPTQDEPNGSIIQMRWPRWQLSKLPTVGSINSIDGGQLSKLVCSMDSNELFIHWQGLINQSNSNQLTNSSRT